MFHAWSFNTNVIWPCMEQGWISDISIPNHSYENLIWLWSDHDFMGMIWTVLTMAISYANQFILTLSYCSHFKVLDDHGPGLKWQGSNWHTWLNHVSSMIITGLKSARTWSQNMVLPWLYYGCTMVCPWVFLQGSIILVTSMSYRALILVKWCLEVIEP